MLPTLFRLGLISGLAVIAAPDLTRAATPLSPPVAPPVSDGSSGSFDAQFGSGLGLVWFNTDNGQVWDNASGGYVAFTVPFKSLTWNKQTFNAYNFTDMNVESTVNLVIYGSKPAMFLATSAGVSFAGHFIVAADAGAGGAPPDQNTYPYIGGTGTSLKGKSGGHGGSGPIGGVQGQCSPEFYTGGGGGGGGNHTAGGRGRMGDYPVDGPSPAIHNPGGAGGKAESAKLIQGGAGGGAGGGGFSGGNFWGFPGANGGGAVLIATSGSIAIASTGVIDVSGAVGDVSGGFSGSSGGGAGGDEWFYASGTFSNGGTLIASGGAGGTSTYTSGCFNPKTVKGPNGGNGAGGVINMTAPTIRNNGVIDVSTGGGGSASGGEVVFSGTVVNGTGSIIGRAANNN
jgi:hypothetical protein